MRYNPQCFKNKNKNIFLMENYHLSLMNLKIQCIAWVCFRYDFTRVFSRITAEFWRVRGLMRSCVSSRLTMFMTLFHIL